MRTIEEKPRLNFWQSIEVGCAAGATEALINHPLYVWKMRSQASNKSFKLYTGLLPNMTTMILLTGIRLSFSTILTEKLDRETQLAQEHKKMISSFIGGGVSSLVGSPMELLRYRQLSHKTNFYNAIKNLYAEGGYKIFFTGLAGTALRDSIYTIGFFPWRQ